MPCIASEEIDRLKAIVSSTALVETSGVVLKSHGTNRGRVRVGSFYKAALADFPIVSNSMSEGTGLELAWAAMPALRCR